jgi:helicase
MERVRDEYLLADTEAIMSKMGSEPALRTHVLSAIATGYAEDREDLMKFIGQTFFAQQMDLWTIDSIVDNVIDFLEKNGLITTGNDEFKATMFGHRTSDLYIDPLSAVIMKEALARSSEVDANALCALHACCSTPDMPQLYLRAKDPDWLEAVVADNRDNFLLKQDEPDTEEYQYFLSALKTACMLEQWMGEVPENEIVKKFNIGPGDIRARVENGEWLLYSMREIARLHGNMVAGLLNPLVLRIRYGIKEELLPLVSLKGIGRKRARTLFGAGYKTNAEIMKANVKNLEELPGIGKGLAYSIKEQVG